MLVDDKVSIALAGCVLVPILTRLSLAAAAVKAKKYAEAKVYNDKLIAADYQDGGIYENQYEIALNAGDNKAAEIQKERVCF